MKLHALALLAVGIFAGNAFAQKSMSETAQVAASKFDAALAKRVGADEHGMRKYVLAILKTGPNDAKVAPDEQKEIFKGHFANMKRLADEGKLAVAGPFNDPARVYRGLFIFAVPTVEEAKALAETDPAVKAGILVVEYIPWFGSASLMLSSEFHEKVQEKSF
ncbi:MAG: hypothetical protein DMF63_13370 [Acidobacteria bacterium]|nr:MAG: hypothetical protein DMF63_13370 [Acidobacteriota bacterium]